MNANELMHNDLIMYGGDLCRFIIRATDARIIRLSDSGEFPPCAAAESNPIPLTEEILKANGFERRENPLYNQIYYKYCGFKIYLGLDFEKVSLYVEINEIVVIIDSVNKLQNVLRLCGLSELADNFVVE